MKKQTPWEDSLILAFRDVQWMLKQRPPIRELADLTLSDLSETQLALVRKIIGNCLDELSSPPPLLAKFDGNAESASGDVLTAQEQRFFLLEFKAERDKSSDEKGKFIHALIDWLKPEDHRAVLEMSLQGHYMVHPKVSQVAKRGDGIQLDAGIELMARQYANVFLSHKLNTAGNYALYEETSLLSVMEAPHKGLQLDEMAAYLAFLCAAHGTKGGSHPMKAAIVTNEGMGMIVADISELQHFAALFLKPSTQAPTPCNITSQALDKIAEDYRRDRANNSLTQDPS